MLDSVFWVRNCCLRYFVSYKAFKAHRSLRVAMVAFGNPPILVQKNDIFCLHSALNIENYFSADENCAFTCIELPTHNRAKKPAINNS